MTVARVSRVCVYAYTYVCVRVCLQEWSGVMGWTQDGKPLVGALPASLLHGDLRKAEGSVFIGAGFNGHGMPVSANLLCV